VDKHSPTLFDFVRGLSHKTSDPKEVEILLCKWDGCPMLEPLISRCFISRVVFVFTYLRNSL
jgi:hypothetical protein